MSRARILDRIEGHTKERRFLLDVLKMWGEAENQGVNPDDVARFGFDSRHLTGKLRKEWRDAFVGSVGTQKRWNCFTYYVRRSDGENVLLAGPIAAVYEENYSA